MMSDGDEDPLQLLHDIDELLTTNLERWEGINNGVWVRRVPSCLGAGVWSHVAVERVLLQATSS